MFPYLPATDNDIRYMLDKLGLDDVEDLFKDIPGNIRLKTRLDLDPPKSELEVMAWLKDLADQNLDASKAAVFLGAGVYDHYIPAIVKHLVSRSEFYTAYTPYQPEISQGTLQAIFEYQSMICALTGMDVSNASLYDGASALAEAALMAVDATGRDQVLVSETVNPESLRVLKTYLNTKGIELIDIPMQDGVTDIEALNKKAGSNTAAILVQSPNFLGFIEDLSEAEKAAHENKALFVISVDPISLGILKTPAEWNADIAVGEGQSLGSPMSFGGPGLGFIACKKALVRRMPGRIIGQTQDVNGKRGFVSTLQTREQHIRREKATSNICSNQALNALAACIYLSTVGREGIKEIALQCWHKAHYAASAMTRSGRYKLAYDQPFFMEFPVTSDIDPGLIQDSLLKNGIIGGLSLEKYYPELKNTILYCVTEKRTREEIDTLCSVLEGLK